MSTVSRVGVGLSTQWVTTCNTQERGRAPPLQCTHEVEVLLGYTHTTASTPSSMVRQANWNCAKHRQLQPIAAQRTDSCSR